MASTTTGKTPLPPDMIQLLDVPDEGLEECTHSDKKGDEKDPSKGIGSASEEIVALSSTSSSDEDSESMSSSRFSSCISLAFKNLNEVVKETSSDTEEEERPKQPRLDEELVTEWYDGPLFMLRDQRQCNEYFLRGKNLIRCYTYLQEGHDLSSRHSRRLSHTLYAGKHNSLEHRNKNNSDYVKRARAEYEALLVILHRQDKVCMNHYLLAALVTVQKSCMPVLQVRLMEVTLLLLKEVNTSVEDMQTVMDLCKQMEFSGVLGFLGQPPVEVMVGVVHSLLYRMTPKDLHVFLHQRHKCIYQLACAPVFGMLGYHAVPPTSDIAIIYNNSAKIFHDYLGDEAHLMLLLALHTSLLSPRLGQLSDKLFDRVARAAKTSPIPPGMLRRLEHHMHTTDSRPGPQGCVAMLRLLRRCHRQGGQLQDLPALLRRLVALLVSHTDRPLTVARDLGRLLLVLRKEGSALLQCTVKAGMTAIKDRMREGVCVGIPEAAAQHFLVNLVRLVVVAARAVSLPPGTYSDSDWESDRNSKEPDGPETRPPVTEEMMATLLGLCGRQTEPRASWSGLACEVSYLLLSKDSGPQDCQVVEAVLQLAMSLEDGDHHHATDDHQAHKN